MFVRSTPYFSERDVSFPSHCLRKTLQSNRIAIIVSAAAILAAPAFSTPVLLSPGGSVTSFSPENDFSGTQIDGDSYQINVDQLSANYAISVDVNVYAQADNTLTFYFQIDDIAGYDNGHSDPVTNLIADINPDIITSVSYVTPNGVAETPPSGATRDLNGAVNFADAMAIRSDSDWLEVATNATTYDSQGTADIYTAINNTAQNQFELDNFFEPLVPATSSPEPVSAALLGLGLSALILRKRR